MENKHAFNAAMLEIKINHPDFFRDNRPIGSYFVLNTDNNTGKDSLSYIGGEPLPEDIQEEVYAVMRVHLVGLDR